MSKGNISAFAPPPEGEPDVEFSVVELGEEERIAASGIGPGGEPFAPIPGGSMRRRPGIDDEEDRDAEPTGWCMPEWD